MNQKKLNVLFIAKNVPVKGIHFSRVVIDIARHLNKFCGIKFLYPNEWIPFGFHFFKKYKPFYKLKLWSFEGFKISISQYIRIPLKGKAFKYWNSLSKNDLAYYKEQGPFDLIHAHYLFPDGYLAYLFSKKFKVPYIVTIRNADLKLLRHLSPKDSDFKKAKQVVNSAQYVLTLNQAYQTFIEKMFSTKCDVIPHGIERDAFRLPSERANKKTMICTVAEAIKRKNIDWVVNGVLKYEGKRDITLTVIGKGPLLEDLKESAKGDNRIVFTGRLKKTEVYANLANSDIFALPSFDETFGMVYLEAAANRNAIIGLKNEGVWGVFKDNEEVLYCENEATFVQILHQLIDNDHERERLKEAAFLKAKQLTWDKIASQYETIYRESIDLSRKNKD